jgi:hypothetical protein
MPTKKDPNRLFPIGVSCWIKIPSCKTDSGGGDPKAIVEILSTIEKKYAKATRMKRKVKSQNAGKKKEGSTQLFYTCIFSMAFYL